MKKTVFVVVLAALLLATLACDIGGSTPTTQPPVNPPVNPPSNPPSSGTIQVTLNNNTSDTVCYVYISPTSSQYWGDDWLGSTEVIGPGESRTFDVPAGDYDLRADDCNQNPLYEQYGFTFNSNYTWNIP